MTIPKVNIITDEGQVSSTSYDSLIYVSSTLLTSPSLFKDEINKALSIDNNVGKGISFVPTSKAAGGRLILSSISSVGKDTDDVRSVSDAVRAGMNRAKGAGSVKPLLILKDLPIDGEAEYARSVEVALLAALEASYEMIEAREFHGEAKAEPFLEITALVSSFVSSHANIIHLVGAIEAGRRLARDIGGADPERMSPYRAAEYIKAALASYSHVKVEVKDDVKLIEKEYPLLHAVARASCTVQRHRPCIVHLEYTPDGDVEETLLISGKGVTYDTGGADVKAGGHMAGMSRDKCGAAAGAGLVLTAAILKAPKVKIIAELGFVRNSIGADSYVADEIITSHAGTRVCVGNTDAEGRMVLSDCLSHLRDQALKEKTPNPRFMTIATLTGHVLRAYGTYTAVMDNGPAAKLNLSKDLQRHSLVWGDPFEVSTIRREDVNMIAAANKVFHILQCNNAPSSGTARGHQFPAAFIIQASGLDSHGKDSKTPFAYTHIDIAGSALAGGDFQFGKPTATPIVPLTVKYLLTRPTEHLDASYIKSISQ
eukprot:TRINITY_DN6839_c0_g2_i1.p1 TRINITY_DN6839_c0_g2~~TRINITY_DN6839_c0_g2_i1.p1  ORF type:complete len:541 (-),score=195.64 TRINITY_DN6839_c0_g2_i1:80-1702(-)